MPLGKLIKTDRTINIYKKTKSRFKGESISEININSIPLDLLKATITPNDGDPFLYDGYPLTPDQLDELNTLIEPPIKPDHKKFDYILECYGIYDET